MDIKYSEYSRFANILSDNVLDKLIGIDNSFERFNSYQYPSRSFFIGSLNGFNKENSENEDSFDKNSFITNSMSIKFLLKDFMGPISIKIKLSIFYRVYPSFQEQKDHINSLEKVNEDKPFNLARIWKRQDINFSDITFFDINNEHHYLDFSSISDLIKNSNEVFTNNFKIPQEAMKSEEEYNKVIKELKSPKSHVFNWDCKLSIQSKEFIQEDEKFNLIEILFTNETEDYDNFEPAIFNPILNISLNNNDITPFKYHYTYEGNKKFYETNFRFLNCHGDYDIKQNKLITKGYAKFFQKKVTPKSSIPNINLSFKNLSDINGLEELKKLSGKMEEHYLACYNSSNKSSEYKKSLSDFDYMKKRYIEGINLLSTDKNVLKSFCLMNKTFNLNSEGKNYDSWRLFQIVFIVSLLKDVVDKSYNRDNCELLHVMTGGGKSEAYFGIVIFSAFYDRIIGKEFGVTAITKFPLRMLSIQQLQRIANLFIFAEEVRIDNNLIGEPFSIAYFVGSQEEEFPKTNRKILKDIEKNKSKNKEISGKIINTCPLCEGEVVLDIDYDKSLIVHRCKSCQKIFRLYFSDDEIYRTLPTFIVATVDKFAGISMNRRVKNLFGGKLDECEDHGFIPRNDFCSFEEGYRKKCGKNGTPIKKNFNTGPTLMIQDEMHLIKEGFGTIDSHFESLCEVLEEELTGEKFKHIVMTATVTGAEKQIQHLYNKNIKVFPPMLIDSLGNDFFFNMEKEDDGTNRIQRQIIGLKPSILNSRIVHFTLLYISMFLKNIEENLDDFCRINNFKIEELKIIIESYKKLLTYHNRKNDAQNTQFLIEDLINKNENCYDIEAKPLTGESNLEDIKKTINLVEKYYENDENRKNKLLTVNATSIVSHGVDLDQWNIMIFDGMPRNTSEYIQALSRVGRKDYGLIFLTFINHRTRDLSFYQHFNEYHDILEHKVESVPLSRWAKLGFKQTFTSIFNASILNYLSDKLNKPIYNKEDFIEVFNDSKNVDMLVDFIQKAYMTNSPMKGSEYFKNNIRIETEKRIEYIKNYSGNNTNFFPNALADSSNKYFKTQFGMRGIQDDIVLTPFNSDYNFRSYKREG